ncbi:hypothetical protein HBH98_005580 [Parastagonospora nodorum]|nr:hypothetical protein HBI03_030790 [Parastagonospora nodorum]KAH4281995.1 hypothetical protein HBI04_025640 [Parastagonospora nodorum]KAH4353431.1 hypothetical protein HBH98_005580 [Parastagonospora nodorum]KAH4397869.1 hypothetical protein HBH97_009470 [Parastagonospora nodorum]KAH4420332.1 hypothetical protein HBH92_032900 [Parastagonospora nodorum]
MRKFATDFTTLVNDLLNEAGEEQPMFQSYGAEDLKKLKDIRSKYDLLKVFTELMHGGWKLPAEKAARTVIGVEVLVNRSSGA